MTDAPTVGYRVSVRDIRLGTGLALAAFIASHLINHALGLWSIEAMESYRQVHSAIWQSVPGVLVLYGSLAVHFVLALYALYQRSHLRLNPGAAIQLTFGILVPALLVQHVVGSRLIPYLFDFDATYYYTLSYLWLDRSLFWQQTALILIVWTHFCVGLHFWLRVKPFYSKWSPLLQAIAVVIPLLGWLGFIQAGKLVERMANTPGWLKGTRMEVLQAPQEELSAALAVVPIALSVYGVMLVAVLVARYIRRLYRNRRGVIRIEYPGGRVISAPVGPTILEISQTAGIPHASVCGGRGRCTTCRVQIVAGAGELAMPSELEAKALRRIKAPPDVRLACQTRPSRNLAVAPLLPPTATARDGRLPGGLQGQERQVAILFVDLRGSTKLGEERLPYDVVFILNQFFAEMAGALKATNGHYAQFNGDGLMALYGLETSYEEACRDAIAGAVEMQRRMERINLAFEKDVGRRLRIGVGVHSGDAIVGMMGPPASPIISAIGDNVNVAARLEGLTKDYACGIVLSAETAERGGVDCNAYPRYEAELRGRDDKIAVFTLPDEADPFGAAKPTA